MRKKLLKKDYSQELEEIAESKGFEKEAQNLLLSMLYKVEGAYNDYQTVKREVPVKEEFLQNILDIVKKFCKEIQIARPNSLLEQKLNNSKYKILEENENNEKKVIIFPNEKIILYSLIKAGAEKTNKEMTLEDKAMLTVIQIGKCISYSEVIRDFNGFSWTSITQEIENFECNCIYTDLIYLLGEKVVNNINANNIIKLKRALGSELYEEMQKVALRVYLENDKKEKEKFENILQSYMKKLKEMKNQSKYIENISLLKRQKVSNIKEIDEILNNPKELRKEYLLKNSKLPNEKKIFSVSHYEEMLQQKRKELLQEIEEYSKLQNPIEFVKIKSELENKLAYYDSLNQSNIKILQEKFIKCFEKKLKNKDEREKVLDYIYQIRYLKYLPINKTQCMKDIINFEDIEKKTINKGLSTELITPISNNIDTDYLLLKSIFNTKNISIKDLSIRLSVEDGKLKSEIYDDQILDSINYMNLPENSNVQLRKTKKVKIFNI